MNVYISPSQLRGSLDVPAGKSEAQRMVAMATLCEGVSHIYNFPDNKDSAAALRCARALGALVQVVDTECTIRGNPQESAQMIGDVVLDCGESGLASRLFACIAALYEKEIVVSGCGSLMSRPFDTLHSVFTSLKVDFSDDAGSLPLRIQGPIKSRDVIVDGSVSSQFVSGLLIALSAHRSTASVVVQSVSSQPYIHLTVELLRQFGVHWRCDDSSVYVKTDGHLHAARLQVPGDWSAAATMMVAAVLCADGEIELRGLNRNSVHADSAVMHLLAAADVPVRWSPDAAGVLVRKVKPKAFEFDFGDCPDLVPVAMVLAAASSGECKLLNTSRLRYKESNRAWVMQQELAKAGITVKVSENEIAVLPGIGRHAQFSSHGDHRVAMAMSIFAMANAGGTVVEASCVDKSYANFFDDLALLGASLKLEAK